MSKLNLPWQKLHEEAMDKGADTYVDPESLRIVFTAGYLKRRGYCCGSGCRHCPYPKDEKAPE